MCLQIRMWILGRAGIWGGEKEEQEEQEEDGGEESKDPVEGTRGSGDRGGRGRRERGFGWFLSFNISLLIWLHQVLVAAFRIFTVSCWGLSLWHRFSSCDTGPTARGILVPQPGNKHTSPILQGRFLTTGPPGKPLGAPFLSSFAQQEARNFWSPTTCERVSDKQCKDHPWAWQDLTKWKGGGCQWTCAGPFGAYEEPSPIWSYLIPVPALCIKWDMYSHTHFKDKKAQTQAG